MTAQDVATVALAALKTALPASVPVFDIDKMDAERPVEYVEIGLSRLFGGELRASGDIATTGYRLTLRAVAQVSVSNVRDDLEACRAALEFTSLTVGGKTSTPIQFETEDPAGYDDGWFSGLQSYTFVF